MSENAITDQNHVGSRMAVLNTDTVQGTNLVRLKINPAGNGVLIDSVSTISFTMVPIDPRDENYKTCMTFQGTDGNIYPWVANSLGAVLVDF